MTMKEMQLFQTLLQYIYVMLVLNAEANYSSKPWELMMTFYCKHHQRIPNCKTNDLLTVLEHHLILNILLLI